MYEGVFQIIGTIHNLTDIDDLVLTDDLKNTFVHLYLNVCQLLNNLNIYYVREQPN